MVDCARLSSTYNPSGLSIYRIAHPGSLCCLETRSAGQQSTMKQSHTFTKRTHALQQRQQVGDYDSTQIHWSDGYANLPPVRPCGRVGLSWSGGVPPYILQGRWWPQTDSYTADSAREWIIAMNMQNTTYDWLGELIWP